ncbi:hypothetical protein CC77DRAFT_305321 [Alternaria alternata]|uniref:DUF7514 domain-containing protein n=1 Tax=Alternaria alternata TaxID=5599 RepID=A0A177E0C4_ALTAL|nr:hypothetical protein CC77DRAFT_305321 [Alternaria alternata]OAG25176.1 hypothetical protein CC77DRAFT_305321 [Alternaria alternata]RYO54965.1 hypothetical protein AA0116_g9457 [Alternaria tenuissima]
MAYRDQPDHHNGSYVSPFDKQYYDRGRSPDYGTRPKSRTGTDGSDYQPRDTSPAWDRHSVDSGSQPMQQPLKSAIGHAFEKSDAARVVDPDLIAQITEQVKKSVLDEIKSSGMAGTTHAQAVPVSPQQWSPPSPMSTSNSIPPRDVYTPPSPKRTDFPGQPSPERDPLYRDPLLDGNNSDIPTPRPERSAPVERERPSVRPGLAPRMMTEDYTPIEKMWQRLFEADGQPLPRLGQLLRGLALHLIEDYEPKHSLVISPAKMLKFYEEVKLKDEIYPWSTIFGEVSYSALSKIYRDMRCQHHLIQEHPAEAPYIPALTPAGFQEWMTTMIQAYPDTEYDRLVKAILDMPISNADDRKERFPKELPRRMFPTVENLHAQQRCAAALSSEGVGPLRRAPTFPPPPPKTAPPSGPKLERERSPYSGKPEVRPFDFEDEPMSTSVPIERERKPYSAAPGGGKSYTDDMSSSTYSDGAANERRRRAQSSAGQGPFAPPPPDAHYHQQPRHGSNARPRSPSFSSYGTQSDPTVRDIPNNYYASNMHNVADDSHRYGRDSDTKRHTRQRSGTGGMNGSFDSQTRSAYDDDDYLRSRWK